MIFRAVPELGCVFELLNVAIRVYGGCGLLLGHAPKLGAEQVRSVVGAAQVSVTHTGCPARNPQKGGPRAVLTHYWARCSRPGVQSTRDPAWLREDGPDGVGCARSRRREAGGWWRLLGLQDGASPTQDRGRRGGGGFQGSPAVTEWALTKRE